MNDRHFLLLPLFAAIAALSMAPMARADETAETAPPTDAAVISENSVVKLVMKQNPTLAAAIGELRRAELLEQGEGRRFPFFFLGDAKAMRNGAPALGPNLVTFPESTNIIAGAELRRRLVWGTDLSLRVEATRQESFTLFTFATPSTGMGGMMGAGTPIQTLFHLGPGYGGSVRLGLTQPLLRGFGRDIVEAELNAARANRETARSARDRTSSQALREALTAYWELYYASRAVEIQRRNLALARQQRDEAVARIRTGSIAPVEKLTFDSRIATLEEEIASAEAEEKIRSGALARAVGDPMLAFRRADDKEPVRHPEPHADTRKRALEASFEIAEQKSALKLAEVQARSAADSLRPRLDVDGYVQAYGLGLGEVTPALTQIGTLRAVTAQVALTFEAPLDDTRHRTERERAELAITVARQKLDAVLQKTVAEVDEAEQRDASARRRIALTESTLTIAREQVEAELARFRTGSGTALQVREAEEQVRTAELRAARGRVDLAVAHVTLAHLTGSLLHETATAR
jgi:outer membrane protein TolC